MSAAPHISAAQSSAAFQSALRTPHSAIPSCLHCGAPISDASLQPSGFCCAGCAYVFRLVHEHGLASYYRLKDDLTAPADPTVFQPRDFAWLTIAQRDAEQAAASAVPELTLDLQGISCAGCVWLIERLFHQAPGARDIIVNAQLGQMRLRWLPAQFDAAAFAQKLHAFNYVVGPANADAPEPESRGLIRRIGLCTAFAMNVMLFTLPVYFGMTADFAYARLFGTLSLLFGTLSVLSGGGYFIARAWHGLRAGAVHIDLPIALGLTGAYLGSLYGWLTHQETFVYFDFVSAFILLMLIGRWAQVAAVERNRRRLLRAQPQPGQVAVFTADGRTESRSVATLRTDDRFELAPGQAIPVAARLESPAATLGTAWISGEADPRDYTAGALLPAGALNLGRAPLRLRATQPWSDSLLAQLLQPAQRDAYRHAFLEKIITGYLFAILALATFAGLGWWFASYDAARTWSVVTAVLVVSCPCAIGLAFPLVDEIATIALRRAGLFVRQADLWPRLSRIRRIVFDKTGTLTLESPQLTNPAALAALTPAAQAALLALVRDHPHPVSQSLCAALLAAGPTPTAAPGELRDTPGFGVSLVTTNGTWALGRPGWSSTAAPADAPPAAHDSEFTHDGRILACFHFADTLRPGARAEFDALRALGYDIFILSGDRPEKVSALAAELGLPATHALAACTPQAKADWLRANDRQNTLMLGDGANDSLAFDAAFARGTPAIHGGILENRADFYYLGRSLASLRRLFALDAQRRRTHRWLLAFSIAYNVVAVGLALTGHMSPLLAAILMPLSSLATLAIVATGMRRTLNAAA